MTSTMPVISIERSPRFFIFLAPACTLERSDSMPVMTFCTASEPSTAESSVRLAALAARMAFSETRPISVLMRWTSSVTESTSRAWALAPSAICREAELICETDSLLRRSCSWMAPIRVWSASRSVLKASATLPSEPAVILARTVRLPSEAAAGRGLR